MKISVIIPTHDRLENLTYALGTILQQDYDDWEVIVSDNYSTEDIAGYISSLNEPRIRYFRTDSFVSVTDNWNNALRPASGDYIIMLGDDDGLTPGYFKNISEVVKQFKNPQVIYTAMYQFANPGVIPSDMGGYLAEVKNGFFFKDKTQPFILPKKDARKAVTGSLDFRRQFTFNIQCFTLKKEFINHISNNSDFYQSPFPDYYIANAIFLLADSIVVDPRPLTIAGITKQSFGFYLINGVEDKGAELLNNSSIDESVSRKILEMLLPGSAYQTNYLLAMCQVASNYGKKFNLSVNFKRYRRLQIFHFFERYIGSNPFNGPDTEKMWEKLSLSERIFALFLIAGFSLAGKLSGVSREKVRSLMYRLVTPYKHNAKVNFKNRGGYKDAMDVYNGLSI